MNKLVSVAFWSGAAVAVSVGLVGYTFGKLGGRVFDWSVAWLAIPPRASWPPLLPWRSK